MKPEKQTLLDDLLSDEQTDARRGLIVQAGGRVLRRRRWKRAATRSLSALACLAVAIFAILRISSPQHPAAQPVARKFSPTASPPAAPVHYLTDDELLALFPGTPVGLLTKPDGKKKLIFPRPGDEQRYVVGL